MTLSSIWSAIKKYFSESWIAMEEASEWTLDWIYGDQE